MQLKITTLALSAFIACTAGGVSAKDEKDTKPAKAEANKA